MAREVSEVVRSQASRRTAHRGTSEREIDPYAALVLALCPCRRRLDALGGHPASPRSGLLRSRAVPLERAVARACREAGATVATKVLLRDLNRCPAAGREA